MKLYRNIMEELAEQAYDELKDKLDCCQCDLCRNDIIAYALNQVTSKYVVTTEGYLFEKLDSMVAQNWVDLIHAITEGAAIVGEHPRHPVGQPYVPSAEEPKTETAPV